MMPTLSRRWLYVVLALYAAGFALFRPRAFLVVDEERYVSQAVAFAQGALTIAGAEILSPPTGLRVISNYPPGTSLLQTPFVWALGWRGAALASVLSLVLATLVTARWLRDQGHDEAFALLIPGFLGAAFFGRVGMSDVPSAALVAATCLYLWRASAEARGASFAAGLCAGATVLFREPLVMLVAPLVIGAMVRRRVALAWLLIGGGIGLALRMALAWRLFGSPFYVRDPGYGFSLSSAWSAVPIYGAILLVMIPGGLLLPFLYRGPRRAELVTAMVVYVATFMFFQYDSVRDNGLIKGVILSSRYMVPLLPVLVVMAADVWPRVLPSSPWLARGGAVAAAALAALVHPLAHRQEEGPVAITRALYAMTSADTPVITNSNATLKYLSPAYGPRRLILRYAQTGDSVVAWSHRVPRLSIALLDRNDSEMFRAEREGNERFLNNVRAYCALRATADTTIGGWARLRSFGVDCK